MRRDHPLFVEDGMRIAAVIIAAAIILVFVLRIVFWVAVVLGIPWYVIATALILLGHFALALYVVDLLKMGLESALLGMERRMKHELHNIVHTLRTLCPEADQQADRSDQS